jgi:hypothetical protein
MKKILKNRLAKELIPVTERKKMCNLNKNVEALAFRRNKVNTNFQG